MHPCIFLSKNMAHICASQSDGSRPATVRSATISLKHFYRRLLLFFTKQPAVLTKDFLSTAYKFKEHILLIA